MVAIARHETAIARDRDRAIAQKLSRSHTRKSGDRARSPAIVQSPWEKNFFVQEKFFFVGKKNQRAIHGGLRLTLALGVHRYTGTPRVPESRVPPNDITKYRLQVPFKKTLD